MFFKRPNANFSVVNSSVWDLLSGNLENVQNLSLKRTPIMAASLTGPKPSKKKRGKNNNWQLSIKLMEFMYLLFTRMPCESYRTRLGSLLLCLCDVLSNAAN